MPRPRTANGTTTSSTSPMASRARGASSRRRWWTSTGWWPRRCMENVLPWGLTLAGKATWASGFPRRIISCPGGFPTLNPEPPWARAGTCVTVEGDSPSFRQVDLSISKQVAFGAHNFSVRADVLNLFNVPPTTQAARRLCRAAGSAGNPTSAWVGARCAQRAQLGATAATSRTSVPACRFGFEQRCVRQRSPAGVSRRYSFKLSCQWR